MGHARVARMTIAGLCCALALSAVVPMAEARRVDSRSATGILPKVYPVGRPKPGERTVRIVATSAADARIEATLQVYCFDAQLRVKRRDKVFTGTGRIDQTLKRPRGGGEDCSTSASVRVVSRPQPATGRIAPIRLTVRLGASR